MRNIFEEMRIVWKCLKIKKLNKKRMDLNELTILCLFVISSMNLLFIQNKSNKMNFKVKLMCLYFRRVVCWYERSYNENYTPSRPLWEVKSHLAWLVVRWVTTCEVRVLFVLFLFFYFVLFEFELFYLFILF